MVNTKQPNLHKTFKAMFNPFKIQLSCYVSISTEDQERFLDFINSQLMMIGCDRSWREGSRVIFSNNLISFSRRNYHVMAGVNNGAFSFGPANQLIYEYRITNMGIAMFVFYVFILLLFGLTLPSASSIFPIFFMGMLILVMGINWVAIRYRQKQFLYKLEPEYQRMKQVFAQPR